MKWLKALWAALLAVITLVGVVFLSKQAESQRKRAKQEENLQNLVKNSAHQAAEHQKQAVEAQKKAAEIDGKIDKKLDKLARNSDETLQSRLDAWNSSRLHDDNHQG